MAASLISIADFDGDEEADLLYRESAQDPNDPDAQHVQVRLSTGTAFATATNWGTWDSEHETAIADVDGDDAADLIGRSSTGQILVAPSLTDHFEAVTSWATTDSALSWSIADANSDGEGDLVLRNPSSGALTVRASNSSAFLAGTAWGNAPGSGDVRYADMDGSGSDDVLLRTTSSGAIKVSVSDGEQYLPLADWGTVAGGNVQLDIADINADDRDDVLVRNTITGAVTAYRSTSMPTIADEDPFVADPNIQYDDEGLDGETQARAAPATPVSGTATMKIAWSDDVVLVGSAASAADSFILAKKNTANAALTRMRQAGTSSVRLIVYWGQWRQRTKVGSSYKEALVDAVDRIHAMNMNVYMTITGAWYDDLLNGKRTSLTPDPAAFGTLVSDIVSTFRPLGVRDYAMWNEPNLPARNRDGDPGTVEAFLQRPVCANGRTLTTAKLYQQLYQAGYAAANAYNVDVRVYLGELSENANIGHPECSAPKNNLNAFEYLTEVATDRPGTGSLTTNGVAWHPYQQRLTPNKPDRSIVGIGRINGMRTRIQNLIRDDLLKTPTGQGPRLYLTEFGYFNRPLVTGMKRVFHSEARRAGWLRAALRRAREVSPRPRMFTFYKLAEFWPTDVGLDPQLLSNSPVSEYDLVNVAPVGFDTGLAHPLRFEVTGVRPYGIGDNGQPRQAFCAIRKEIRLQPGYSIADDNTGLTDQCPAP